MPIRPFVVEDRRNYMNMSLIFYNSEATDHPVPDTHFERTFDVVMARSPFVEGWIIETEDGHTAGYILATFSWSCEAGGQVCWLDEIFIKDEHRGRGLGHAAMAEIMAHYQGRAIGFRLEVTPVNRRALNLYHRLGFREFPYLQLVRRAGPGPIAAEAADPCADLNRALTPNGVCRFSGKED